MSTAKSALSKNFPLQFHGTKNMTNLFQTRRELNLPIVDSVTYTHLYLAQGPLLAGTFSI